MEEVIELCSVVMEEVLSLYRQPENWQVEQKADGSPLTRADLLANDLLVRGLKKISPEMPLISEELPFPDISSRRKFQKMWMIDPIDGTYGFVNKTGDFTINIALIEENTPVLGVVGVPVTGEVYFASSGEGAYVRHRGHTRSLGAMVFSGDEPALHFVCSPKQKDSDQMARYFGKFTDPKIQYRGGTIKFLMVARGDVHIYPNNRSINEWDTAAGQIIVEEAGGLVIQANNHQRLKYNKPDLKNPPFIVYGDIKNMD